MKKGDFFISLIKDKQKFIRRGIDVLIPLLIFFFFVRCAVYELRILHGNTSGFIRFNESLASARNPIFWNSAPELLFENSDLEKGTLENWSADGDAFRFQPTKGDNVLSRHLPLPANHQGRYWIGTFEKYQGRPGEIRGTAQGDAPSGCLYSTRFIIKEKSIGFLIGGGRSSLDRQEAGRQSVALEVDGKVVREASGHNLETMELRVWDVARWQGQSGRIIITDDASRQLYFRHINADWFHYYRSDRMSRIRSTLVVDRSGYDGQFFYYMAFDPFLLRFRDSPGKYRMFVDEPMYRYGRIGFPLLIKLASLDRPEYYPQAMMGLIVISHFFGAFFLLRIIRLFRQSPWWTLLYVLIPGYYLSLYFALPESIAMAFLLAGLYLYLQGRTFSPALLFVLSILLRETSGFALLAIVFWEFFKNKNMKRALVLTLPFFSYLGWRLYMTLRLFEYGGWKTLFLNLSNLTLPFSGLVDLYRKIAAGTYPQGLVAAAAAYPVLLAIILIFSAAFFTKKRDVLSLSLLMFSLISISLNFRKVWVHVDNGARSTFEPFLFLLLVFLFQRSFLNRGWLYLILGFFGLVFAYDFYFMTQQDIFRAGFFLQ